MIDDVRPRAPQPVPETDTAPSAPPVPGSLKTAEPAAPEAASAPEAAAAADTALADPDSIELTPEQNADIDNLTPAPEHQKPRGTGHHWFNLPWPPNKLEIIVSIVILVLAIGGGVGYELLHHPAKKPAAQAIVKPKPKATAPALVPSTLSGMPVAASVNQRPVIGVMVENSTDARPQSGLSQAGVVFEALAEGGVTRFLALYQDQQPASIGPIRSSRPYFLQWLLGFKAAYAHVGGSPDALADIKSWGVQDMDQFYNASVYTKDSARAAPHNVYASEADLAGLAVQKNYTSAGFTGFARKTAAPAKTPTASTINLSLSSSVYNVQYTYNATTNSYARAEGGQPQMDANTDVQLSPAVVIAIVVPLTSGSTDAQGAAYSDYNPLGDGVAYVFQDGGVTVGSWHKASNTAQLSFTGADGAELKLNPGQTWITAISASTKVSYQ